MLIKEAAQNLYDKKQISEEEYNSITSDIDTLEKVAGGNAKLFDAIRLGILGIGAGTGAVLGGTELYKHIKTQNDISNSFRDMQTKVPALTEYPQDRIKDYFEVIKTFSPKSASNPLVAGALVHKMLEFGGVDHKLVQDLNNIENSQPGFLQEVAKASITGLIKRNDKD